MPDLLKDLVDALVGESNVQSLQRYIEYHIPTGSFLRCVLENDLFGAVSRADNTNIRRIPEIVLYIRNNLPCESYGSPEKVHTWLTKKER